MDLIEKLNLADFHRYLRETDNTICGRYPISLLLAVSHRILMFEFKYDDCFFFRRLNRRIESFRPIDYRNFRCNSLNMLNRVKLKDRTIPVLATRQLCSLLLVESSREKKRTH